MNRLRKAVARGCCGMALLLGVAASAVLPAQSASAAPLKIAYSDWPGYLVWEIALQKGFFKSAGVDVEMVWFEYGPSIDAFTAGKVDAAAIVTSDGLVTGANGKAISAIVLEDYSDGSDMIVGKPGVTSFKALKGKKVALEQNLVEHLLLLKGLEVNGMSESDVTVVPVSTNETPQTLASGKVDAIGAWYPISGQALKQVAGSKPLFTSKDAPGLIYDALFVSKDTLAAHRAQWEKVVAVWFRSLDYMNDPKTHDDAVKIMAARVSVTPKDFERNMKGTHFLDRAGNAKALTKGNGLDSVYGSMKYANAFYTKAKVYKESQDVNAYVDPSLVTDVLAMKKK